MSSKFSKAFAIVSKKGKNAVYVLFSKTLNKGIGMISTMVITRVLTQVQYGIWTYAFNIFGYLELLSGLGLAAGAYQFGMENHGKNEEFKYYKYCLRKGIIINGVISALSISILLFIELPIKESKPYTIALCPLLILTYILLVLEYIFLSENRIAEYAKVLNINTILNAAGICLGSIIGIEGIVIGKYIAVIISIVQILIKLRKELNQIVKSSMFRFSEVKDLWHYSLFTGASAALNLLLYLLDITMIGSLMADAEQLSLYKVGTLIPSALSFIPNSVVTAYLPQIVYNRDNPIWIKKNVKKMYVGMAFLNICLCVFLYLLAPYIISFTSGLKYLPAVPVFRILIIGYGISGTFRTVSINLLAGFRKVNYNLFVSIVSGMLDIILNYILIKKYQMMGASYATLLVEIVTSILAFGYLIYYVNNGEKHV